MSSPTLLADPDADAAATGLPIDLRDLTMRFGSTVALDAISTSIEANRLVGLLGRNGAGKSTLMATIAAYLRPTTGTVRVDGHDPYEHPSLMGDICLVRHDGDFNMDLSVADTVSIAATFRPRWDAPTIDRMLDRFELRTDRTKVGALSRGQRSALAISIGLATRAPVSMFDEPHLGLDAPSRYAFYDELLASYMDHPRTIVVSTHLIDEMATMFGDVVIIDRGALLTHEPAEDLQGRGMELTGPARAVDTLTDGLSVLSTRSLGGTKSVVVVGGMDPAAIERAARVGVEVGPIPLQDLFVALTNEEDVR